MMPPAPNPLDYPLSVAPMMDWTDRHCRFFLRLLAPRVVLYTEMVTTGAIIHGRDPARFLGFDDEEKPLVLQLGGADPADLARCAAEGADWGYDAINLNCGCPSDRVQSGRFGACLMGEPGLVADCVRAMRDACAVPVTVKCRIGIEPAPHPERAAYETLADFVGRVREAGARMVILHARVAVLDGLSPKENREIPPLRHEFGHRLKRDFPDLRIVLNGGIGTIEQARAHLPLVDEVMIGRIAYQEPYRLAEIDAALTGTQPPSRHAVVEAMLPYIEARMAAGAPLKAVTRHMLGLFQGLPGARRWRRLLSEEAHQPGAGPELVQRAALAVASEERRRDAA